MNYIELLIIGISLAMDAFAVSITKGFKMKTLNFKHIFFIAFLFGIFQAGMPFLGWMLGKQFANYIREVDHWIAFFLLGFIGVKMIFEAIKEKYDDNSCEIKFDYKETFILAIATSIDALAVGITFSFMINTNIVLAISIIGVITFCFSFLGVILGKSFSGKYGKYSEIFGGFILIILGSKILLQHLFFY